MAQNGVAIGYGQRDSGVRYMPISPGVGLVPGQASLGAALQDASKAFLHGSAAVAELQLNAQRDQLDKLGTDLALQAERNYSILVHGDPSVPGSGFVNRMDAENFVGEYEERFKGFRESALQSVPAPLRDRIDQHLQKIKTRQFVELNGLAARQSREGLIRSRGAYAEFCAASGDMAGMEEAVRAIPGLTPEEQELRISQYQAKHEKEVTLQSQAANHADAYHAVSNDPNAATRFLLEMGNRESYLAALTTYGGKSKVDELITAARAQIDADGFAGIDEWQKTGNAKGLSNAAMGANFTAAELEALDAASMGRPEAVSLRQASMELDIAAAPAGVFTSPDMRAYLAERESVWKALGASEHEVSRAREAIKTQAEKTNGRLNVGDLLKRAEAARPRYFLQYGNSYRNGLPYRPDVFFGKWADGDKGRDADKLRAKEAMGIDLKGEMLREYVRKEQEAAMKEDQAWVNAHVSAQFNDWLCSKAGMAASVPEQQKMFVQLLNGATKQNLKLEEVLVPRPTEPLTSGDWIRRTMSHSKSVDRSRSSWMQAIPSVDHSIIAPGVFVPEGTVLDDRSVVLMTLGNGKAVQIPVLGTSGSDQFVLSGGAALRIKKFNELRKSGVRYRVMGSSGFQFERTTGESAFQKNVFSEALPAAQMIYKSEARFSGGKLQVYHPPKSDGGGEYEVAGINIKYHPAEARKLKAMIEAGKHKEAEAEAITYIDRYTSKVKKAFAGTHAPGAEAVVRDMYFNSPRGAVKSLNKVLGLSGNGLATKRKAVDRYIAEHGEAAFIRAFSAARVEYYQQRVREAPKKAIYMKGWVNRVRSSQQQALAMIG